MDCVATPTVTPGDETHLLLRPSKASAAIPQDECHQQVTVMQEQPVDALRTDSLPGVAR